MSKKDSKPFVTGCVGIVAPAHPGQYLGQVQIVHDPVSGRSWAYGEATGNKAA